MVVVDMIYMAFSGVRRYDDHGNAGTISKEVQGLNIAAVEVSAAFIRGDQNRGMRPEFRVRLDLGDDLMHEVLVAGLDRVPWVTAVEVFGNQVGHCWEVPVCQLAMEGGQARQVRLQRRVSHDRG